MGARFSAPVQTCPGAHPASYTMGTGTLPGVKRPGRGVDHSPRSSAEVKEKVELYLYSPSGPFVACSRVNLPLPLPLPLLALHFSCYSSIQRMCLILLNSQYYNKPSPTGCGPYRPIFREFPDGGMCAFVGSNCDNSFRMYCTQNCSTNLFPIA
jgi:hypothetical protein